MLIKDKDTIHADNKLIDIVDKDFGWKGGIKRPLTLNYFDCKSKPDSVVLYKGDTITFSACKGQTASWEGTLKWDGRRLMKSKPLNKGAIE